MAHSKKRLAKSDITKDSSTDIAQDKNDLEFTPTEEKKAYIAKTHTSSMKKALEGYKYVMKIRREFNRNKDMVRISRKVSEASKNVFKQNIDKFIDENKPVTLDKKPEQHNHNTHNDKPIALKSGDNILIMVQVVSVEFVTNISLMLSVKDIGSKISVTLKEPDESAKLQYLPPKPHNSNISMK
jgi:beta-glucosidase-like glycosyl hydrolase